jgi:hypothetical protein
VKALPLCSVSPKTDNCMTLGTSAEFILENARSQVGSQNSYTDFSGTLALAGSAHSATTGKTVSINTDPSVDLLTCPTNGSTYLVTSLGPTNQTYFSVVPAQTSYTLYCQGPLNVTFPPNTFSDWTLPATFFHWSNVGAHAQAPSPGECAWYDRGGSGSEIYTAGGNYLFGYLNKSSTLPYGEFAKFEVYRDANYNNIMMVTKVDGLASPPF